MKVRLVDISYGAWESLTVAIDVDDTENNLWLTYPTIEAILNYRSDSVREKIASKSLKAFLGAGQSVGKKSAIIVNKQNLHGATTKVNVISLEDFLKIATWEAVSNQNLEVGKLLAVGLGDSLRSIAYSQLGIELATDDRQEWLKRRQATKETFWFLVDDIKAYIESQPPSKSHKWMYPNAFDAMNLGLFGKKSKQIKEELGIGKSMLNRNHFGEESLKRIDRVQTVAKTQIKSGLEPIEAVKKAIELLEYTCISYTS